MQYIDQVLHLDWRDSKYIGDGVYIIDASPTLGVPSVALRADRDGVPSVIGFEAREFNAMVNMGGQLLREQFARTKALHLSKEAQAIPNEEPNQ